MTDKQAELYAQWRDLNAALKTEQQKCDLSIDGDLRFDRALSKEKSAFRELMRLQPRVRLPAEVKN